MIASFAALFTLNIFSASAAELSQTDLNIRFLRETGAGVLVGFAPSPADCAGSYQGAHAYMSRSAPQFDETVIRLESAQVLGVAVKAYYVDIGDCVDEAGLLQLSNIEIQ